MCFTLRSIAHILVDFLGYEKMFYTFLYCLSEMLSPSTRYFPLFPLSCRGPDIFDRAPGDKRAPPCFRSRPPAARVFRTLGVRRGHRRPSTQRAPQGLGPQSLQDFGHVPGHRVFARKPSALALRAQYRRGRPAPVYVYTRERLRKPGKMAFSSCLLLVTEKFVGRRIYFGPTQG